MQVGDLVTHTTFHSLGVGLVTEVRGVHCMIQWSKSPNRDMPTLEVNRMLEVVSASR